jgi:hypothetical protein
VNLTSRRVLADVAGVGKDRDAEREIHGEVHRLSDREDQPADDSVDMAAYLEAFVDLIRRPAPDDDR